jgi:hypothetical protein
MKKKARKPKRTKPDDIDWTLMEKLFDNFSVHIKGGLAPKDVYSNKTAAMFAFQLGKSLPEDRETVFHYGTLVGMYLTEIGHAAVIARLGY